jgi:ATP synthase subunit 6
MRNLTNSLEEESKERIRQSRFLLMLLNSPLEQFEIVSLIPLRMMNIDISITNSSLYLILGFSRIVFFFNSILKRTLYIPNAWQTLLEDIYVFIVDLINQNCGVKGQRYFKFIFTLFVFLLTCNLMGMVPYSFTVTSHIVITLTLSIAIWVGVTIIGLHKHGLHFFHLFAPSGAPAAILPILVIIEVVSYIIRALSLGVRLFANMMSGHTLLKIMAGFSFQIFAIGGILGLIGSAIPLIIVFLITGLEIGIACLQAYVFTILTIMYLNDSINLH